MEQRIDTPQADALAEPPIRRVEGDASLGLVLLCDHAENTIPEPYGTLGLDAEQRGRHIAYDIGIAGVVERLAEQFGAPALLTRYSRLLIDPNRGIDDPTLIMQISDGVVVPGNAAVSEQERQTRIARYYQPYHRAIDEALEAAITAGRPPVLLSMHSFTQAWKSVKRPWDVTVLWDKDPRLARPLLRALEALPGVVVGENVPYTGKLRGDTVYRHGTRRGLAHALIEIRQDLLLSPKGQAEWAGRFADILRRLLGAPDLAAQLAAIEYHGSHADGPADTTPIKPAMEAPHG